ncbi:hypothetical protein BTM25_33040 [Actinomadura rubteroloni]|uniref:DUF397 domain-containing protein n=1 Tax=Actinomadura rubteroloni TaxID=1926885 RepID=A0A2P4UI01_9ACTN|nr:DUF397 domain-containing protein [Actinomadura rubteroloni]POM24670.1 hypothetical protein BTM25_33040 [Actinomadura rubteroloni]
MSTFEPRNWRKSRHSGGEFNNCVEAGSDQGRVGIRDTTDRQAGAITLPAPHFAAVLAAARTGALDL